MEEVKWEPNAGSLSSVSEFIFFSAPPLFESLKIVEERARILELQTRNEL